MTLPRPVKAVVFDMDGLLFDTERLHSRAALAAAAEVGCPLEMDVFLEMVSTTEDTDIGASLQRVLTEIDEIAEATLASITLETMLKSKDPSLRSG